MIDIEEDEIQRCPVHNIELKKEWVFVHYGLIRFPSKFHDYPEIKRKSFPYSNFIIYGGCMVCPEHLIEETKYCRICRKNHLAWSFEHKSNFGLPLSQQQSTQYVKHMVNVSDDEQIKICDDGILDYLKTLTLLNAVKILKSKNPSVAAAALKNHIEYLRVKADIEEKIQYHDEVEALLL